MKSPMSRLSRVSSGPLSRGLTAEAFAQKKRERLDG
jgi:hypothetical protein